MADGDVNRDNTYRVTVKMDGANSSVRVDEDGLRVFSRGRNLAFIGREAGNIQIWDSFRGLSEYVLMRQNEFLALPTKSHVFGEWLVHHSLPYPAEMYQEMYVFDPEWVVDFGLTVRTCEVLGILPGKADLVAEADKLMREYVARTVFGAEGVVLAPLPTYPNSYRFKHMHEKFIEQHKKAWSPTKVFLGAIETALAGFYSVRSYQKVCQKIVDDKNGEKLTTRDTPQVLGRCKNDFYEEHFAGAIKKLGYPVIDTKKLNNELDNRVRDLFITEMTSGHLPVYAEAELRRTA